MDNIAKRALIDYIEGKRSRVPLIYGVLCFSRKYDADSKLDNAEAEFIFAGWFFERLIYVGPNDPPNINAGKFNIHNLLFTIICFI